MMQHDLTTVRCSKRLSSKTAADESTGGVAFPPASPELRSSSFPKRYVEDAFEAITPLAGFFSTLVLGFQKIEMIRRSRSMTDS